MKKLIIVAGISIVAAAVHAASVDQVVVRQQWPWSTDVKVEYKLLDVTGPVDLTVKAFNGATELVLPKTAIKGNLYGVADSVGSFTIDPVAAFGTDRVGYDNFKVQITLADSPANINEVIYKIFDLEAKTITNVTRADLFNNKYGAWTTDYGTVGTGFNTTLDDVIIWTDVVNYPGAKTTKLVMRKVNAANKTFTFGTEPGTVGIQANETNVTVRLTEDFFIGVFELTQKQYELIMGASCGAKDYGVGDSHPAHSFQLRMARGCRDYTVWNAYDTNPAPVIKQVNWPNNTDYPHTYSMSDTVTRRVRSLFNWASEFDLPTEAQWEFACRAGSTTQLYNGHDDSSMSEIEQGLQSIAWIYFYNSGWRVSETQEVGLKKPNAYGLYDMIGNVLEQCLDWYAPGVVCWASADVVTDPVGPTTYAETNPAYKRVLRGGHIMSNWYTESRIGSRPTNYWGEFGSSYQVGCRLVCPATENGKWASSPEKTHY